MLSASEAALEEERALEEEQRQRGRSSRQVQQLQEAKVPCRALGAATLAAPLPPGPSPK